MKEARYLGPRCSARFAVMAGLERRLVSGRVAWNQMGNFWTSGAPIKWKAILSKGYVVNALLTGLEALAKSTAPLESSVLDNLEGFAARRARAGGVG